MTNTALVYSLVMIIHIYGKKSAWAYVHPWSSHVTFVKINFCYKQEITYVSQIIKKHLKNKINYYTNKYYVTSMCTPH